MALHTACIALLLGEISQARSIINLNVDIFGAWYRTRAFARMTYFAPAIMAAHMADAADDVTLKKACDVVLVAHVRTRASNNVVCSAAARYLVQYHQTALARINHVAFKCVSAFYSSLLVTALAPVIKRLGTMT